VHALNSKAIILKSTSTFCTSQTIKKNRLQESLFPNVKYNTWDFPKKLFAGGLNCTQCTTYYDSHTTEKQAYKPFKDSAVCSWLTCAAHVTNRTSSGYSWNSDASSLLSKLMITINNSAKKVGFFPSLLWHRNVQY